MIKKQPISTLFLDIGGVLLTDGWNRDSRAEASKVFQIDANEMQERHHINFSTYELGKMTLDTYLDRVIFYEPRAFSKEAFKTFMLQQSQPYPEMISLFTNLKKKYGLRIGVISNEGRELNEYRIEKFKLNECIDFFISSSIVHLTKPDIDIFNLALDIARVRAEDSIYVDNQPMFVEIGETIGMHGIHHTDYESTVVKLKLFGINPTDDD